MFIVRSDTLRCTYFCKEDRRAVNSWNVRGERVGLVGRIHCRGVESGREVCGVWKSPA